MKAWKAELFLLLVTFIWGGTFLFTKIGINDCPPSLYVILRFSIAFTISFILFGKNLLQVNKKVFIQGIILGLFFGGGFVFQTYGLKYTEITKSAFITGLAVVLTPFVYWFVERKTVKIWSRIGVFVAAIGLWLFTRPDFGEVNFGDFLTLCSTIFWALYITYMDVFTRGTNSFKLTSQLVMLQFTGAMPVFLAMFFIFDFNGFYFNLSGNLLLSLAYNSIMASFLLTFIHTNFQKYTNPVKAALIFSLEPILASFFAIIFMGEILTGREYLGALVLFMGVLTSEAGSFITDYLNKLRNKSTAKIK